jgi:hypothetical protein
MAAQDAFELPSGVELDCVDVKLSLPTTDPEIRWVVSGSGKNLFEACQKALNTPRPKEPKRNNKVLFPWLKHQPRKLQRT